MAIVDALSAAPGGRRRLRLRSPVTLEPLGTIEVASADEVHAAVERARKAQTAWGETSFHERGERLRRALRVLLARSDEFVAAIAAETGKPRVEILAGEIAPACDAIEYWTRRAERVLADRVVPLHLRKRTRLRIRHRPLGVVGILTPGTSPLRRAIDATVQALAAGNGVVLKPSQTTPGSGRLVEELFRGANLPEGLVACVVGDTDTGRALVGAGVDRIAFTGAARAGREVAEACGRALVPCSVDVAGKGALVVCADADLERAATGAVRGAFANAGQGGRSIQRVWAVGAVADELVRRVVAQTAALRQGGDGEADVGPLLHEEALAVVEQHVADALARGARALAGGRRNPGWAGLFWEPTVLVDADASMLVMRDDTPGPLLAIERVRDEAEAIARANASGPGLDATVWTRDRVRGRALAASLATASVVLNGAPLPDGLLEAPLGGAKHSGVGWVHGDLGLRGFCRVQSIVEDRFGAAIDWASFPYDRRKALWLERMMRIVWGTPLGRWLS